MQIRLGAPAVVACAAALLASASGCQQAGDPMETRKAPAAAPLEEILNSCPVPAAHGSRHAPIPAAGVNVFQLDETIYPWQSGQFYVQGTRVTSVGKVFEVTEAHLSDTPPHNDGSRWSEKRPEVSCSGRADGTLCWDRRSVGNQGLEILYPGTCGAGSCLGPMLDPDAEAFARGAVSSSQSARNFNIVADPSQGIIDATWIEADYEFAVRVLLSGNGQETMTFIGAGTLLAYVSRSPSGAIAFANDAGFQELFQGRPPAQLRHLAGSMFRLQREPQFAAALGAVAYVVEGSLSDICAGKCSTSKLGGLAITIGSGLVCAAAGLIGSPATGLVLGLACGVAAWAGVEIGEDFCEQDCRECYEYMKTCCNSEPPSCSSPPGCSRFADGCRDRKPTIPTVRLF
jgi:hypothetical protein